MLRSLFLLSLGCLMVLCSARLAVAAIIHVTTTDDDDTVNGNCTLREAIRAATSPIRIDSCTKGDPGADTINVPAGTYILTTEIQVSRDVTIVGAGMSETIIDGGDATPIFVLQGGTTEIRDLTIQRGRGAFSGCIRDGGSDTSQAILRNVTVRDCIGGGRGGAIHHSRGMLTLINSTVTNNIALTSGGGIQVESNELRLPTHLTLIESTVSHNRVEGNPSVGGEGDGGGIWVRVGAVVTILDSTFEGNEAARYGGAILNAGTLSIERSTFFNNIAAVIGGAISSGIGPVTIVNSTLSGNQAGLAGVFTPLARGGAIDHSFGSMSLLNCTIIYNRVANLCEPGPLCPPFHEESINAEGGGLSITNTVLAKKEPFASNRNCSVFTPPLISGGHNFDSDGSCGLTGEGDISGGFDDGPVGLDPSLGPLADNGGPTLTHKLILSPPSPLLDTGGNLLCPPVDQRGFFRPRDGNNDGFADCDIGAVESQLSLVTSDFDVDGIENSQDNCPITFNPDQADSGGVDSVAPDGIGDACQCGDVSDEGVIDILDVAILKRHLAALAPGLPAPQKCRVARLGTCDATDLGVLRSALVGLPPGVERFCEAALPQ